METPGERPPTRLQVVCQEGWDGARRHPQPAAGVQSAEQWCSSQSPPQPQLRYQHGSGTGHAAQSTEQLAGGASEPPADPETSNKIRINSRIADRQSATANQRLHRLQPAAGPRSGARRLWRPAAARPLRRLWLCGLRLCGGLQRPPGRRRPLAARRGRALTRGPELA